MQTSKLGEGILVPTWLTTETNIEHFRLGVFWFHHSLETGERESGPLTEAYLLDNIRSMSERGLFDGWHDQWAIETLAFLFGMLSQQQ